MNWCGVVTFFKIGCSFVGIRGYNRRRSPLILHACQTFDGTPSNNDPARSRLFERQKETKRSFIPHFRDYLQFLLRKCDEESDDDTARKRDSELVRCG